MDRSIYPDRVEVQATDLQRTEAQRAFHILQRFADITRSGVSTGIAVATGSTAGRININITGTGRAYTPSGDIIEMTTSQVDVPLADSTNTVVNLICITYVEVEGNPGAHETDGTVKNREATRSFLVDAKTQVQYDALSSAARDQIVILATVVAAGNGNPVGIITQQSAFVQLLSARVVTAGAPPPNVTGIEIVAVSAGTATGTDGLLDVDYTSGADIKVRYSAPGDAYGALVQMIGAGQPLTVTSSGGQTLQLIYDEGLLPSSDVTDNIEVYDLGAETGQRFSAEDLQHRSLNGRGLPTATNPHGLDLRDLDALVYYLDREVRLGDGLVSRTEEALVPRLSTKLVGTTDFTLLWEMDEAAATYPARLYGYDNAGLTALTLVTNARWTGSAWVQDNAGQPSFRLDIDQPISASMADAGTTAWKTVATFDGQSTNALIQLGSGFTSTTGDAEQARILMPYRTAASGDRTRLFSSNPAALEAINAYRGYDIGAGPPNTQLGNSAPIEVLFNGIWSAGQWARVVAGDTFKVEVGRQHIGVLYKASSGAPWDDDGWDTVLAHIDQGNNRITTDLDIRADRFLPTIKGSTGSGGSPVTTGMLYEGNVPRAWGRVSAAFVPGSPALGVSFGIASVAYDTTYGSGPSTSIVVTLAAGATFALVSDYGVVCTVDNRSLIATTLPTDLRVIVDNINGWMFRLTPWLPGGAIAGINWVADSGNLINFDHVGTTDQVRIAFTVFGHK